MNTTTLSNFMRLAAMVLLFAVTTSATAQTGNTLVYEIEHYAGGIGCVYVTGWVYDRGIPNWQAGDGENIEVYGIVSTTREENDENYERLIADNVEYFVRDDINQAYGLNGYHGFRITFNLDPYRHWFENQEDGTLIDRTLWLKVYAAVKDGSAPAEELDEYGRIHILLGDGPIAVPNVKSPEWQETHVTQKINGLLYTGFTATDPTWKNLVDGDFSTYTHFNNTAIVEFTSDEVLIPDGLWFDTMYSFDHYYNPKSLRLYAKLHKEDNWTELLNRNWPSTEWDRFNLASFPISYEEFRGYRYFRLELDARQVSFLKEIRFAAFCYKHLLPRLATCSQVGILKECYQRDKDGKYFADDAATTEYNASDVEIPKKNHEGNACEGAGCWQCYYCKNYFSDEACTTPYPTWSVTLPEQMELTYPNPTFQEDSNGKYIQGTVIHFKAKELYKDYISNVKVGETVLIPDQDGVYTLTVGDADAVVTATVSLLVLDDKVDNADAISAFSGQQVLVRLKDRTLYKDGLWNTLCLPFDMSAQQVTEQLAPTRLKTLESASFQNGKLTLNFTDATEIQAGKPYIIRWTKADDYQPIDDPRDLKNALLTGVTIPDYSTTSIVQVYSDARCQTDYVDFVGTYAPLRFTSTDKSILILAYASLASYVNIVSYPNEGATIGCGRGYFMLKGIHANVTNQIKEFVLNTEDDDATSIEQSTFNIEHSEESIYDLSGRKVNGQRSSLRSGAGGTMVNGQLPKGVYIVNGKKIIK